MRRVDHLSVLADKVAIITGASSGIGEAVGLDLARAGSAVVLAARREERLSVLVRRIVSDGGRAVEVACDVRRREQVEGVFNTALRDFGRVDVLINNAGVMPLAPMWKCRFDDWDRMLDVNVRGALYAIGAVLPHMIERNQGHIVNVGSVAGRIVFPNGAVYCGTKHALHAISDGLRSELSLHDPPLTGIRVTIIAPGVVKTELPDSITDEETRATSKAYFDSMQRPLRSEDISAAIMYALQAPPHVDVNEILIRPVEQVR